MDWKERRAAYSEKLKDPRWQQLRLRVFERDAWTCQLCGRKDKTLHVHHARYQDGEPWETNIELLVTACADCHEDEHETYKAHLDLLLILLGEIGVRSSCDLMHLDDAASQYLYYAAGGKHRNATTIAERASALAEAIAKFGDFKAKSIASGDYYYR